MRTVQDPMQAWAEGQTLNLVAHFGPPEPETVEQLKAALDALSHRAPALALQRAEDLVAYADRSERSGVRVIARLARANALLWLDRLEEALAAYEEARALAEAGGEGTLAARCGIGKMGTLLRLGRPREALALADAIEPTLASAGDRLLVARVRSQRATALTYLGDPEGAIRAYGEALVVLREISNAPLDLAIALHNQALLLLRTGSQEAGRRALEEAEEAARRSSSVLWQARIAAAAAELDLLSGRYARALVAYERTADLYEEAGAPSTAAAYRLRALECWLYLGQFERVAQEGRVLGERLRTGGFLAEAARARYFTALALRSRGRLEGHPTPGHPTPGHPTPGHPTKSFGLRGAPSFGLRGAPSFGLRGAPLEEAAALLEQALRDLEAVGRVAWWSAAAQELAALRLRQGDLAEAERLLLRAQEYGQEPAHAGRARLVEADLHFARGDLTAASRAALAAHRLGRRYGFPWLEASAHRRLARSTPSPVRRRLHLLCGVRSARRILSWIPADLRWSFFREVQDLFGECIVALAEASEAELAWKVAQQAKSRDLAELIARHPGVRLRARVKEDAPLVNEVNELLDHARAMAMRAEPDPELHDLSSRIEGLLASLLVRNAEYGEDAALLGVAAESERPELERHTALVEYVIAGQEEHPTKSFGLRGDPQEVLAFVLTQDKIRVVRGVASLSEIRRLTSLWALGLRAYARGQLPEAAALRQANRVLSDLYDVLLRPLWPDEIPYEHLIVSPFGVLWALPFHAFLDRGVPLWERMEVSYIPAGSLLPLLRRRSETPWGPMVAVAATGGDRVPRAVEEAERVARCMGGQCVREVTRAQFLDLLEGAGIVHVAAHCTFQPLAPLLSAIHLADGPVLALDLLDRRTEARLVVLSGCDTGVHAVLPGDELHGFARAWFHAGAARLVLSLWPVPDESTCRLMDAFYRHLAQGSDVCASLRSSALEIRSTDPHPLHWAGFVVLGGHLCPIGDT
jgi:tetratricopeptide (TPR) repeat protein